MILTGTERTEAWRRFWNLLLADALEPVGDEEAEVTDATLKQQVEGR